MVTPQCLTGRHQLREGENSSTNLRSDLTNRTIHPDTEAVVESSFHGPLRNITLQTSQAAEELHQ